MSGWNGSERRSQLPPNWASEIVPAVKKRDKGRCVWRLPSGKRCPRPGTDVDHIDDEHDHSLRNLRLLCAHHHAKRTAVQGRRAKAAKKASRYRPGEDHPGRVR